jgi:hypothetical protein
MGSKPGGTGAWLENRLATGAGRPAGSKTDATLTKAHADALVIRHLEKGRGYRFFRPFRLAQRFFCVALIAALAAGDIVRFLGWGARAASGGAASAC